MPFDIPHIIGGLVAAAAIPAGRRRKSPNAVGSSHARNPASANGRSSDQRSSGDDATPGTSTHGAARSAVAAMSGWTR